MSSAGGVPSVGSSSSSGGSGRRVARTGRGGSLKRVAATTLVVLGLADLAARALVFDAPPRLTLRVARKFWSAGTSVRLLNSVLLRNDPLFARALLDFDARTPLTSDALLVLSLSLQGTEPEDQRRRAAYVLAPRRVLVGRAPLDHPFELRAVARGARP